MTDTPLCCRGKKLPPALAKVAAINAVLSDANRLRLICLLKAGETCVCELWEPLALPQNLVSHHLKVLKSAGLVKSRKDGTRTYYSLNAPTLSRHLNSLTKLATPPRL